MCVQMIHELMHLYQLMYHPYQTTLYQYSYFNRLLLLFSARFQIKATIIVIITAIIKRITSNGHSGIPNGIKITVSSITAWHVTRKINAKIISFLETPSSLTASIIPPAPNANPMVKPVTKVKDVFSFIP